MSEYMIGGKVPLSVAITGATELAKLAMDFLHTAQTNPKDQAELDARWTKMQAGRDEAKAAWQASKA